MTTLKRIIERHALVAVMLFLWTMGVVTYATLRVFGDMAAVSGAVASCYAALLGIPAISLGFVQSRLNRKGGGDDSDSG